MNKKILGFTGTRSGFNDHQFRLFRQLIESFEDGIEHIVHGGCIGVDHEVHQYFFNNTQTPIHIYPGVYKNDLSNRSTRADCGVDPRVLIFPEDTMFKRNKTIVQNCDLLIGVPFTVEHTQGGTWHTIEYARKTGKSVIVISPDNQLRTYNL